MSSERPGGRTSRTREAVFRAAAELLAEKQPAEISMASIAERAGVAVTSLYRRWGDVATLLLELAIERLIRDFPLPDTGSLRGDLVLWIHRIAKNLRSAEGSAFFRIVVLTTPSGKNPERRKLFARRLAQVEDILVRARERNERAPSAQDVIDHVLAPLYMRALVGNPANDGYADRLIDRALTDVVTPAKKRAKKMKKRPSRE